MGDRVDIAVLPAGLERGSDAATGAAAAADAVVQRLSQVAVAPAALGQVDQAEPLASAVGALLMTAQNVGRQVSRRHTDLAQRSRAAAAQGDQLVRDTTGVAAGAMPSPALPSHARPSPALLPGR